MPQLQAPPQNPGFLPNLLQALASGPSTEDSMVQGMQELMQAIDPQGKLPSSNPDEIRQAVELAMNFSPGGVTRNAAKRGVAAAQKFKFQHQLDRLIEQIKGGTLRAFHGTTEDVAQRIAKEGFQPRSSKQVAIDELRRVGADPGLIAALSPEVRNFLLLPQRYRPTDAGQAFFSPHPGSAKYYAEIGGETPQLVRQRYGALQEALDPSSEFSRLSRGRAGGVRVPENVSLEDLMRAQNTMKPITPPTRTPVFMRAQVPVNPQNRFIQELLNEIQRTKELSNQPGVNIPNLTEHLSGGALDFAVPAPVHPLIEPITPLRRPKP